jgi:hypothetical protein
MGCNNNCDSNQEIHICNQCNEEPCTGCEITDFSTDCVLYDQDDVMYGDVVVVPKNTILSIALDNIVQFIKARIDEVQNRFRLVNTGVGANIYSGETLLGEKKIRSIKSANGTVVITEGTDDIDLSVPTSDGSETKVTSGTNISITGIGTTDAPYVVNSSFTNTDTTYQAGTGLSLTGTTFENTSPDQVVTISGAGATTVTGTYPNFAISSTDTNTSTIYQAGTGIDITGAGTVLSPYVINNRYFPVNVGAIGGGTNPLDVGGETVGGLISVSGDITSASVTSDGENTTFLLVTLANNMNGLNYLPKFYVESLRTVDSNDALLYVPTFRIVSSNTFYLILREDRSEQQSVRIYVETFNL